MRIRKTAAVVLALIVVMSLAMPVFAATGYGSGTSGSGSSYTPPSTSSTPTASNPAPVTTTQVTAAATEAIKQAATASGGGQATVSLVNVSTVPAAAIKNVFTQATKAGVTNTVVQLDAKEGGVVLSRVYVDAAAAAKLTGTVDFSVKTNGAAVTNTVNKFEKLFDNKIAAVSLGQKGAFGADIKMAAKVDLSKLDTKNLVFYAYDKTTGKYAKLTPTYRVDSKGYLHFSTPVGGDIIISDKLLARK